MMWYCTGTAFNSKRSNHTDNDIDNVDIKNYFFLKTHFIFINLLAKRYLYVYLY